MNNAVTYLPLQKRGDVALVPADLPSFKHHFLTPALREETKKYPHAEEVLDAVFLTVMGDEKLKQLVQTATGAHDLAVACFQAVTLDLPPTPAGKLAYLYAGFSGKLTYKPSYIGYINKAKEAGYEIAVGLVYKNDVFELDLSDSFRHKLLHKLPGANPRGVLQGGYCSIKWEDNIRVEWVPMEEITKMKNASTSQNGPWKTWFDEMAKKSIILRGIKTLPLRANDPTHVRLRQMAWDDQQSDLPSEDKSEQQDRLEAAFATVGPKVEFVDMTPRPEEEIPQDEGVRPEAEASQEEAPARDLQADKAFVWDIINRLKADRTEAEFNRGTNSFFKRLGIRTWADVGAMDRKLVLDTFADMFPAKKTAPSPPAEETPEHNTFLLGLFDRLRDEDLRKEFLWKMNVGTPSGQPRLGSIGNLTPAMRPEAEAVLAQMFPKENV